MRRAISVLAIFAFGASLWAEQNVQKAKSDNPRPITYQSLYSSCLVEKPLDSNCEKVTIAGKHCESGDVLFNPEKKIIKNEIPDN